MMERSREGVELEHEQMFHIPFDVFRQWFVCCMCKQRVLSFFDSCFIDQWKEEKGEKGWSREDLLRNATSFKLFSKFDRHVILVRRTKEKEFWQLIGKGRKRKTDCQCGFISLSFPLSPLLHSINIRFYLVTECFFSLLRQIRCLIISMTIDFQVVQNSWKTESLLISSSDLNF